MTLPEDFIKQTKAALGDRLWQILAEGLASEPPVSIRLNPAKCGAVDVDIAGCTGRVPWCEGGFYLGSRPNFTFDPMLHAGLYYVQEASSMFIDLVLRQYAGGAPVAMLDLCAAPGGKSTTARGSLPESSLLVCNEPMPARAQILAENMMKYGHADVIVTNNYPKDFGRCGLKFDIMLADVPCSGEGMFRKDPAAVGEWSLRNVDKCWRLQREIVADAWPCLRDGGLLVYSTCTFNTHENEENVRYICEELGAEPLVVAVGDGWGVQGSVLAGFDAPVYRFLPGLTKGEGLFTAVMRKHGDSPASAFGSSAKKTRKERRQGAKTAVPWQCLSWLRRPDRFEVTVVGDAFAAIPKAWKYIYDTLSRQMKVLTAGIRLGEVKGKDVVPSQALALSADLDTSAFPRLELDYDRAISYLRKEAVPCTPDTPRGYVLMTYKGAPLGFEKNIGNRANNLYPAEWKIKSTHTPEGNNEVLS